MSIIFTILYFVSRIAYPESLVLDPDNIEDDIAIQATQSTLLGTGKPILTFIMVTLAFGQWIDFLKTTDFLNKYLSLLGRALKDMGSFLVIFTLF